MTAMEVDMDMDVAWCLTCSKRTRDSRSTYCSDACRRADSQPSGSTSLVPLTSPVPAALYASPSSKPADAVRRASLASPTKSTLSRPPMSVYTTLPPPASEIAFSPSSRAPAPRDRRAFSFPDAPTSPPAAPLADREPRKSSAGLPPFARRALLSGLTPLSPPLVSVKERSRVQQLRVNLGASSTGGANTPNAISESVFFSTSESSDDEIEPPAPPVVVPAPSISLPLPTHAATVPSTLQSASQFSTLRSQLSLVRANSLQPRDTSRSPVAALVASSASSRSREDIISWAKAIDPRRRGSDFDEDDEERDHEDAEEPRGRSRLRKREAQGRLSPKLAEPLDAHAEEEEVEERQDVDGSSTGPGTTPKGRIGSALAGLSMSGYSVIKALTSVTATPARPSAASYSNRTTPGPRSALDLTAIPAPAEVSRVAVVASTVPLDDTAVPFFGHGTPTLSTISFSEAVDPSVIESHDHIDIVTDDGGMSAGSSSGFARRVSIAAKSSRKGSIATPSAPPIPSTRLQRAAVPARPTSAFWSISNYLSRFAPFSISSVIAPYAPFAAPAPARAGATPSASKPWSRSSSDPSSSNTTPESALAPLTPLPAPAASPMPAPRSRPDSPGVGEEDTAAQDMVRSLPMDIVLPQSVSAGGGKMDDIRERQMSRMRSSRSRPRDHSRSRRKSRSRSRSSSAGGSVKGGACAARGSVGNANLGLASPFGGLSVDNGVGMTNQDPDADADVSDSEDEEERGRKGRSWGATRGRRESGMKMVPGAQVEEGRRSRSRGRVGRVEERDDGERGRGRGRDRSVRPI